MVQHLIKSKRYLTLNGHYEGDRTEEWVKYHCENSSITWSVGIEPNENPLSCHLKQESIEMDDLLLDSVFISIFGGLLTRQQFIKEEEVYLLSSK